VDVLTTTQPLVEGEDVGSHPRTPRPPHGARRRQTEAADALRAETREPLKHTRGSECTRRALAPLGTVSASGSSGQR
jgi:hypothetical protein